MATSSKQDWLAGPGDVKEDTVEDVPVEGKSVRVRGLPAAYSNQCAAEGIEISTDDKGRQSSKVNVARVEVLQFTHGCIEPTFSEEEARIISTKYGPAFKKVVAKIDELSGVDKEAVQNMDARFQPGGAGTDVPDAD